MKDDKLATVRKWEYTRAPVLPQALISIRFVPGRRPGDGGKRKVQIPRQNLRKPQLGLAHCPRSGAIVTIIGQLVDFSAVYRTDRL